MVTVPAENTWIEYESVTGTGPLTFDFPYFAKADLEIRVNGTVLTVSQFTDTPGSGSATAGYDGGSITLVSSVTSAKVTIARNEDPARTSNLGAGNVTGDNINAALNRGVMRDQERRRDTERSIKVPVEDTAGDMTLPDETTRANTALAFDATGAPDMISRTDLTALGARTSEIDSLAARTTEIDSIYADLTGADTIGDAAALLAVSAPGIVCKDSGGAPIGRSIEVGAGLAIADADGGAGNPTIFLDTDLSQIAGLAEADGSFLVGSGSGWSIESGDSAVESLGAGTGTGGGRDIFKAANAAAVRSALSLVPGQDVLAYDANLQAFVDAFTAPTSDGTAGQFLTTDGAGNLTFATPAGGGDTLAAANETISGNWNYTGPPTLSGSPLVSRAASETLTNKTISLADNTLTGTTAQFNAALSDGSFATLAGSEALSNKLITSTGSTTARTLESRFTQSVNVRDFGAVVDGATDDYTAINNALNSGADEVVLDGGAARIGTTVEVPPGVTFRCHGDAKIVLTTDIDGVRLHGESKFYGTVDVTGVATYTSAALLYDGSSEQTVANVFRLGSDNDAQVHLIGNEASDGTNGGTAVKLVANGSDASISGATQANPVVITAPGHSFTNGQAVFITGVVGMTEINDRYFTVANASGSTFELSGEDGTGHTAYTSGGTAALKAWVMNVRCKAKVEGFDKACWIDQNSSTSACFITSNDLDIEASGSRQGLVMDTDATYDVDGNRIQIRNQTRDTQTTHTVVANKISGQLNEIYLLQWDWVGGNSGSVNALEFDSAARSSRVVTFLAGSYINNASSERSLFIENLLSGENGYQVNDIKPTLGDLRLHSADLRLDNAKALKVRNAGDTADVSIITLDASGNVVVTSDTGAGDGIVFNAANSTGTFTIQQNGATVIQSDANRHLFYPGFAGAANGITFRNFNTAGRTQDFADVTGTFVMQEADGRANTTSGYEVGGTQVVGSQGSAIADISVTFTANAPGAADGSVTIADGSAPTNAELQEYCVELDAKLDSALAALRAHGLIAT